MLGGLMGWLRIISFRESRRQVPSMGEVNTESTEVNAQT
jgi:hypothetical protein